MTKTQTFYRAIIKIVNNIFAIQIPQNKSLQEYFAYTGFILFFAKDINQAFFIRIFSFLKFSDTLSVIIASFIPLLFIVPYAAKRLQLVKKFLLIYIIILAYFAISILFNLTYLDIYLDDKYGVSKVFLPSGGIWAIFFILVVYDEIIIDFCFKVFSLLMFIMHLLQFMMSKVRGGFLIDNYRGEMYYSPYSLTFGVSVALITLFFINYYLTTKKPIYLGLSIVSYILIIVAGNRMSLAIPALYLFMRLFYDKLSSSNTKRDHIKIIKKFTIIIMITFFVIILIYLLLKYISLNFDIPILNSRNIQLLLDGEFLKDKARVRIHQLVMEGIKKHPVLGLGAFGDRPLVSPIFVWGHSHGIVYELWSNLGLLLGIPFVIYLLKSAYVMFFKYKSKSLSANYYLIFFGASFIHLTSLSFWVKPFIWTYLAFFYIEKQSYKSIVP